jgi:hypothetical protein
MDFDPIPLFFVGMGVAGYVGGLFLERGWRTAAIFGLAFASFPLQFVLVVWLASPLASGFPAIEGLLYGGLALGSVAAIGTFFATRDRRFMLIAFACFIFGGIVGMLSLKLAKAALDVYVGVPPRTATEAMASLLLPLDLAALLGLFSGGTAFGFTIQHCNNVMRQPRPKDQRNTHVR